MINIGDSYLVFSFIPPQDDFQSDSSILIIGDKSDNDKDILFLKIILKNNQHQIVQVFPSEDMVIKIGRDVDCKISLQDQMLSRVHCYLKYYINKGWYIEDGNENGNKSTNGTWILTFDHFEIWDGMIFKSNSNLMSCRIIPGCLMEFN